MHTVSSCTCNIVLVNPKVVKCYMRILACLIRWIAKIDVEKMHSLHWIQNHTHSLIQTMKSSTKPTHIETPTHPNPFTHLPKPLCPFIPTHSANTYSSHLDPPTNSLTHINTYPLNTNPLIPTAPIFLTQIYSLTYPNTYSRHLDPPTHSPKHLPSWTEPTHLPKTYCIY